MINFFRRKKNETVFHNMMTLAIGVGSAKFIGLISIPILTRIYSPGDFGIFSVFTSLVAILTPIATCRYVMAIPLPKNNKLAFNVLSLSFFLLIANSILLSFAFLIFGHWLFSSLSVPSLINYWWLIVLGVATGSFLELLSMWATREMRFKVQARSNFFSAISGAFLKIVLGIFSAKSFGLVFGQIFQQSVGVVLILRSCIEVIKRYHKSVKKDSLLLAFRKYSDFPKYRLPSQLFIIFSSKSPLIFLSALFSSSTAGQFGLAVMALGLPLQLIGQSASKAYYAEAAKISVNEKEEIYKLTQSVVTRLIVIGGGPSVVLFLCSEYVFSLVFGEVWRQAGVFVSLLAIYFFFQFVASPVGNIFAIYKKQQLFLLLNFFRAFVTCIVFFLSFIYNLTPYEVVLLYSISLSLMQVLSIFIVFLVIKSHLSQVSG